MKESFRDFWKYVFERTKNACFILFKFMIPISFVIRIIQELNLLEPISNVLTPVMQIVNLPPEMALVWLSTMIVNIYGGFIAMFAIYPFMEPITVAQMTTLCVMSLIAHTFPIELTIAKKTGIRLWVMFCIRFGFAIVAGIILSNIYTFFGWLQQPLSMPLVGSSEHLSWGVWALHELQHYALITCVIFCLVIVLHILQITGIINLLNAVLKPALGWMGIGEEVLPLTVVGLTLGIAYGGGLLIDECQHKAIPPREVFYSMSFLGLFHSLIEDSLLMISMGADWTGVFLFRAVFAFVVMFLMVRVTKHISDKTFLRVFMRKEV